MGTLQAQSVRPEDEYKKLIRVNEDLQPLGEHPFGESISLYDGSLSFEQNDVSASGTGPLLRLNRRYKFDSDFATRSENAFGDWDIVLPHIETLTATGYAAYTGGLWKTIDGWEVDTLASEDPNARCTHFGQPLTLVKQKGDAALTPWEPDTWWKGYHLVLPGQGNQDVLMNQDPATKATYPAVTKDHWRFACLPTTANGAPGEGFLAQAPDGTKYWFDELVYRNASSLSRPLYSTVAASKGHSSSAGVLAAFRGDLLENAIAFLSGSASAYAAPSVDSISRKLAWMLVTRIEDRFGNSLVFQYDSTGHITNITASDGRALSVQYVSGTPRIQSVTLQPSSGAARTWTYAYGSWNSLGVPLTEVTLPDGNRWRYDLINFGTASLSIGGNHSSCLTLAAPTDLGSKSGTIVHPSGLTGVFTIKPIKHARSYVPLNCEGYENNDYDTHRSYVLTPYAWYSFTLTQRTLSGAGLPTQTWSYGYSPAPDGWSNCSSGCQSTIYTDVVNPDGSSTRHTFSNKFDYSEGQLLRTDYYAGAAGGSTLVRSETNHYAAPGTVPPVPALAGYAVQNNVNSDQINNYAPLDRREISQDGDTFAWRAEEFDRYAQVTKTLRSGAGQPAVEEQTEYLNDTTHWVLGLLTRVINLTPPYAGEVVDQNVYDTATDTLTERWRFGQKLMSYAFNSQGQLASFTDGNGRTTTLSNYKRGIPQAIGYPDRTQQSLVVDDFGQILSFTDQAGSITSYAYDLVGRLTRIDYPAGDEQAWYPKTFVYDFVTVPERGVEANHWRRTVAKGAQRQLTYFDARLRPILVDTYIDGSGSHANVRSDYDFRGLSTFDSYPAASTPDRGTITTGVLRTYDAVGRPTSVQQTSELGTLTSLTTCLPGARKQVTDPNGKITTTTYQVFDQPSYESAVKVEAPAGVIQTITRDIYGVPLAIRQFGSYNGLSGDVTKTLVYDVHHRLCRTIEPESNSEVMDYDGANNVAWSAAGVSLPAPSTGTESDCGRGDIAEAGKTRRTYDEMSRVLTLIPPAGTQSTTYGYDALGSLKSAVSGISTWSATHNKLGQLTGETLQLTGQSAWTISYAHDSYGSLQSLTYPDGTTIGYAPDALGRATQVGPYAGGITYFPNGEVASFSYGNGTTYLAEQNARQLLRNFTYGFGSTLRLSEDYRYDANGNITNIDDLIDGRRTKAFGYDDLNRLTSATAGSLWGAETYTYDPLNNIRSRISNSATLNYNYDGFNRLASITGAIGSTFGYDSRGNLTNRNANTLDFDQRNQLLQINGLASYSYDGAGRRVMKRPASGRSTYYFYNQSGQLLYQRDEADSSSTNFIYLGRKLIATDAGLILVAPAGISVDANPNDGSYTVTWSATAVAATYTLQESVNGGGWATVYTGGGTTQPFSGRSGGNYRYQVRACAGDTCTDWTESTTVGVRPALPAVTVPASTINGTYPVSWSAPASAVNYDVQEQVDGGVWTTIATDTVSTTINRPGTTSGSFSYRVSAKNAYGTRGWATSNAVNVDTTYGVVPVAPTNLQVPSNSTNGSAGLSWGAAALATRYVLQQSNNGGTSWIQAYDGSATNVGLSGLADGNYRYQVQACNSYGCSSWQSGSTTLVVLYPPSVAPTLNTPPNNSTGNYIVSWTGVPGQVSYTLQEASNGGAWVTVQTAGNTTWSTSSRANGTNSYRAQACNSSGCGPWSGIGTTVVTHPPATAPVINSPANSNTGSYSVTWTAVSTATSYNLQEQINGGAWATLQNGSATSRAFSGKPNGTYRYQAQACNVGGCTPWSAAASTVVTYAPTTAPVLIVPSVSNTGSFVVSWAAISTATNYNVLEQANGGAWTTIQSSGSTSAAINGKSNGTYSYQAQACNIGGCSAWSSVATLTVALVPLAPTNAYVENIETVKTESNIAHWDAVPGATRYEAKRNDTGASVYSGTRTSFTIGMATIPNIPTYYNFSVRACNDVGCSSWAVGG